MKQTHLRKVKWLYPRVPYQIKFFALGNGRFESKKNADVFQIIMIKWKCESLVIYNLQSYYTINYRTWFGCNRIRQNRELRFRTLCKMFHLMFDSSGTQDVEMWCFWQRAWYNFKGEFEAILRLQVYSKADDRYYHDCNDFFWLINAAWNDGYLS